MRTASLYVAVGLLLSACYRGQATTDTTAASPGGAGASATPVQPVPAQPSPRADSTPREAGTVTLRTDRQSYRAGDPITLTISNPTTARFYFNPCSRILEREASGGWTEVREDRMCTMIAHILDAKSRRTEATELGAELAAGRYRILLALTEESTTGQSRSVRASSAPIMISR